jgi:hypothetical protein
MLVLLLVPGQRSIGQIDADGEQVRAERAHPEAVELRQGLQSGVRVVVGYQVGGAAVPFAVQPDADLRIGLNVLDVLRLVAELRDEPELIALSASPSGVRRGSPVLRPVVSSSVWEGINRIIRFARFF